MNYQHSYHAGNFADVHKHVALTAALLHLKRKETPFAAIDTHAGRGLYDMAGPEAQKTGEAVEGIARLRGYPVQSPALAKYLEVVNGFGAGCYPGSPLIAAAVLRGCDRLIAIEKHPEEFAVLQSALAAHSNARSICDDGFVRLPTLLPPHERRGLILIDPPYESTGELHRISRVVAEALRRFPNGVFLIWYPLKLAAPVAAFAGEIRNAGAMKILSLTFDIGRAGGDPDGRLTAAGLLAINPPFGFDAEMRMVSAELLPLLRRGAGAASAIEWISEA